MADGRHRDVERFHFIEYGLITLLFYKAWRPLADGSVFVLPLLCALVVGTCEEWLQWFVPVRSHVRRRNEQWQAGNLMAARQENLILERYYAPVLDISLSAPATGHRWPDAQRTSLERQSGPRFMIYDSDALPYPVYTWPRWLFWLTTAALCVAVLRIV